ncbi:MAG: DNA-3-methyladenine glycosylase 2 family protein [Alphaproteobacteria bacterium]|nr:DNA-3-methyladenine glycosylase 2 family protein [Alphaproteobacteria bacterium]
MYIEIQDDIDLQKIANSGQCFRVKKFNDNSFRFICLDKILYIKQIDNTKYEISCSEDEWNTFWYSYFNFDRNYKKIRKSVNTEDEFMYKAVEYGKGIRILRQDPFEMLITFIISQRKSIPAIKTSVEIICKKFGTLIKNDKEEIYTFPSVKQLSKANENNLLDCKLGYRLPYVLDAISSVNLDKINLENLKKFNDFDLIEELKKIYGVGNKVANCVSLFAYNRTASVPIDTWIQKIIDTIYNGENPFAKFGTNAGIMQQYAFFYSQTTKMKE